jgi:Derlin-2/3
MINDHSHKSFSVRTLTRVNVVFLADMLYTMSVRYESGSPFNTGGGGGTADYVFMLLFGMTFCLCTFPFLRATFRMGPFFLTQMVYYVMYVWSKRNPTAQSSIWGVPVPAIWLPFAYLALLVLTGSPYFDALHGMGMGHIYYFLVDVVPQVYGRDILVTPNFLIDQIGVGQYQRERPLQDRSDARPGTVGPAPPDNGGHQWGGAGRALGRQ